MPEEVQTVAMDELYIFIDSKKQKLLHAGHSSFYKVYLGLEPGPGANQKCESR